MFSLFLSLIFHEPLCAQGIQMDVQYKQLWEHYKSNFVQPDGRVVDKGQRSISHSEGQGYGMLISFLNDDKDTFSRIWRWSKNNLQIRRDNLFAWSWGERAKGQWGVIDYNNATDGDILIAYALARASMKWNEPGYKTEALKIIEDVRKHLAARWDNNIFLLPAYYGFKNEDSLVLNPSYLIFPAYRVFSGLDDDVFWKKVYEDSLLLLDRSLSGRFKLPPDWISLSKSGISVNAEKSPFFGYEAIRTFLYLSWERNPRFPEGLKELFKVYEKLGYMPLQVDLVKDNISLADAPAGFYAVYARAAEKMGNKALSRQLYREALKKTSSEKGDYYSMSLFLLAIGSGDL
ncbi:MAG: hypothetical protein A2077_06190 [Nitrospirae bacterium GWC2_46_6]|nr:MAG: hypothetical protein A2077_06190 [Nitrospirae bacterium GWC2_46_6]OGW22219.1 MAG: hypothetical protein A2Z82_09810 [Nitrospirae bacterium GWA2_46_11]OGW23249.1 MAG: hypothetical protein A2X55_09790 [Nitrospirae bacterium GWB2_47_37]HAK89627.1 hypothetical protein [Nitrospiraceae bacterium]HCL81560.1 hypothetical protein [Nitrospiraceae bacterium]